MTNRSLLTQYEIRIWSETEDCPNCDYWFRDTVINENICVGFIYWIYTFIICTINYFGIFSYIKQKTHLMTSDQSNFSDRENAIAHIAQTIYQDMAK